MAYFAGAAKERALPPRTGEPAVPWLHRSVCLNASPQPLLEPEVVLELQDGSRDAQLAAQLAHLESQASAMTALSHAPERFRS